MSKETKLICVGHKPPDFYPLVDYLMLCPSSLNMPNELVISDERFGKEIDGASFAEYSQLFGLAELIKSGDILYFDEGFDSEEFEIVKMVFNSDLNLLYIGTTLQAIAFKVD